MTDEQTTVEEHEDWAEEPDTLAESEPLELPRRPRRRLLGAGSDPRRLALLGVLLTACGFVAGVLVEKGQTSSSSPGRAAGGLAPRFAALRSAAGGGRAGGGGGASFSSGGGTGGGGAGATVGQVAYVSGSTLYVTTGEGGTVRVNTSSASTVTKTVKATVKGIHPGETVIVTGSSGANGSVSAESIRVSEAGGLGGGGLTALFGGGGRSGVSSGGGEAAGGGPALFGK